MIQYSSFRKKKGEKNYVIAGYDDVPLAIMVTAHSLIGEGLHC
jgi:hypothetical protein